MMVGMIGEELRLQGDAFSDNVNLGAIGDLKQDDGIVMRVRIDEGQFPGDLRWRGVALDEFSGRTWKKSSSAG